MEFDPRDGTIKEAAVANLATKGCPDARLIEEIEKCDVVCANCHRLRTYRRLKKNADQILGPDSCSTKTAYSAGRPREVNLVGDILR
ncbi:MAG: hypothetical protein M3416_19825 [Acidobacteriota bacterium]|nr:hypothetical protein [Acidobacteriota bacterium]